MGKHEGLLLDDHVSPASAQDSSHQHWLALQSTWGNVERRERHALSIRRVMERTSGSSLLPANIFSTAGDA
jgi:hypothetical protein